MLFAAAVCCCRSDLGLALVNFCRIIPDGLLVFFPSYALLTVGGWAGGWVGLGLGVAVGAATLAAARVAEIWGDAMLLSVGDDRQQLPVGEQSQPFCQVSPPTDVLCCCFAAAELHQQLEAGARLGSPQHLGAHRKVSTGTRCARYATHRRTVPCRAAVGFAPGWPDSLSGWHSWHGSHTTKLPTPAIHLPLPATAGASSLWRSRGRLLPSMLPVTTSEPSCSTQPIMGQSSLQSLGANRVARWLAACGRGCVWRLCVAAPG